MHGFTPLVLFSALAASVFATGSSGSIGSNKRLVRSHKTVLARRAATAAPLDLLNLLDVGNLVTQLNGNVGPILTNITTLLDGVLSGNVTEIVGSVSNELTSIIDLVEALLTKANTMGKQSKSCPSSHHSKSSGSPHPTKKPTPKPKTSKTPASTSYNACGSPVTTTKAKKHSAHKSHATGKPGACRKQPATCATCMTTKEIADILSQIIKEVEVVLTKVDTLVTSLPLVGPILGPLVTKLDGTLGSVLTSVDNLLPGVLDLVCQVLKLVDGLLGKLGLGNLLTGVLGIGLRA